VPGDPVDRYTSSQYPEERSKGASMPLIIAVVLLAIVRYFEVGPFAGMSWWWVVGLFAFAFIWFEFLEKMFGLDKRKAHDHTDKARKDRVRKSFK
jgi:small Trp-rich protein